jgi:dTDP-4-amino-4,6-dideoxygalactose transaminase
MNNSVPAAIPMVDVQTQYAQLKPEIEPAVCAVLASGRYILGPNVDAFEAEMAQYLGVAHAVSCASGTDALHLALLAAGVGPGDEVITTPFTFAATAEAICYVGARPVFADIDAESWNLQPAAVAAALSPATKAILPVHLFGQAADMDAMASIADQHGLALIEDCAQAIGSTWAGRRAGALGTAGAFSFFPSKNLGAAGDAGLVSTDSTAMAEQMRVLRNHGSRERYHHEVLGYNSRLDEIQAAVLRIKLRHLETFNSQRRRVGDWYRQHLHDVAAITLPTEMPGSVHVYHQFTVLVPERDRIMRHLSAAGIANTIYYPIPLHRQTPFMDPDPARQCACPVAERVAQQCLSLPMYPELTEDQVARVAGVLRQALGN